MIDLKFSENRGCSKCGCSDVDFQHCYGGAQNKNSICPKGEHIHKHCKRCGFEWLERCKDSSDKKGGEITEVL